jgi:hypothetical protein
MSLRGFSSLAAAALVVLLVSPPLPAARFIRGDANMDGQVDITDPIASIQNLFTDVIIFPVCLDSQDSNDDGVVDLSDGIATLTVLFMGGAPMPPPYPACGEDPTEDDLGCGEYGSCPAAPEGRYVGRSACGGYGDGVGAGGASKNEECLSYSFADGVLKIRHENGDFNCCPQFSIAISVDEGVVDIVEDEQGLCLCVCLFDLDYEVSGLDPGPVLIRIAYWGAGTLELPIDLAAQPEGTYCEDRTGQYPWGM